MKILSSPSGFLWSNIAPGKPAVYLYQIFVECIFESTRQKLCLQSAHKKAFEKHFDTRQKGRFPWCCILASLTPMTTLHEARQIRRSRQVYIFTIESCMTTTVKLNAHILTDPLKQPHAILTCVSPSTVDKRINEDQKI